MAMQSQTQRTLLLAFILSLAGCGLCGIYVLIIGDFGDFEARVLATTASIGAASILGLAAAIPHEQRRWHPVGLLGLIAVTAALMLALILIWRVVDESERMGKTLGIACTFAVAFPHVGLLGLARLHRRFDWVRALTVATIVLLSIQICYMILAEDGGEGLFRLLGVLAIITVCGTIAVPVLHRVSAIHAIQNVKTAEVSLSLTCPRCGKLQMLPIGRSRCGQCGLRLMIEIDEEVCRKCGYSLYKLESPFCPECGTPITAEASKT